MIVTRIEAVSPHVLPAEGPTSICELRGSNHALSLINVWHSKPIQKKRLQLVIPVLHFAGRVTKVTESRRESAARAGRGFETRCMTPRHRPPEPGAVSGHYALSRFQKDLTAPVLQSNTRSRFPALPLRHLLLQARMPTNQKASEPPQTQRRDSKAERSLHQKRHRTSRAPLWPHLATPESVPGDLNQSHAHQPTWA